MELFFFPVAGATLAPSLLTGTYAEQHMQVRPWFSRFSGPPK
jgi:hypothetical protein